MSTWARRRRYRARRYLQRTFWTRVAQRMVDYIFGRRTWEEICDDQP